MAPRIFFSGPLLDGGTVVYNGEAVPEIGTANANPATARENIAKLKAAGVDFVKTYELVKPEVFRALVNAAREANLPIASHVPLMMTAREAGPMVDSMEHLRNTSRLRTVQYSYCSVPQAMRRMIRASTAIRVRIRLCSRRNFKLSTFDEVGHG